MSSSLNSKFADMSRYSGVFGSTGPKTPQGKAIAARNSTSHGLFARDVVLPSLGEDPDGYNTLYYALCEQIDPRNLIERHYVEAIAAASWKLRRLHRWQAQVYENEMLTEDERLDKLDRVLRHETALHRQIDKSVRQLGREVPALFEGRAHKEALATLGHTDRSCRTDPQADQEVADRAHDNLQFASLPTSFDHSHLDNLCSAEPVPEAAVPAETKKCQNEPGTGDDAEEAREIEALREKEALRERDRVWMAAHPLRAMKKVGRLRLAGSKKRGSTLPLLSSVMLPPKKLKRSRPHAREGGELHF